MLLASTLHGVVIHDGLHVVLMSDPHGNHLRWVFILLFTNLVIYIICCHSDPGEISATPHSYLSYPYDGKLYHPDVTCPTCNIVRPARSKHCSKSCSQFTGRTSFTRLKMFFIQLFLSLLANTLLTFLHQLKNVLCPPCPRKQENLSILCITLTNLDIFL